MSVRSRIEAAGGITPQNRAAIEAAKSAGRVYVIYLHIQPVNQYDVPDPFSQPSYRSLRCGASSPVAAQTQM